MASHYWLLGAADPQASRFNSKIDYQISQMLRGWRASDPPPSRVRPIPITLVQSLLDPTECALADVACMAFFFLLRPGEYTGTTNDGAAFALDDVCLFLGNKQLDLKTATLHTKVSLFFTTQKNQRKGVAYGLSRHPLYCPVRSVVRLVLNHRKWFGTRRWDGSTKLATYYHNNVGNRIRAADVTDRLRFAADLCFATTGISRNDISARSLRAGGAMALLCSGVDPANIKLVGRWESDCMMRYLHQDALPVMQRLAQKMYNHGKYNFLPTANWVPVVIG